MPEHRHEHRHDRRGLIGPLIAFVVVHELLAFIGLLALGERLGLIPPASR